MKDPSLREIFIPDPEQRLLWPLTQCGPIEPAAEETVVPGAPRKAAQPEKPPEAPGAKQDHWIPKFDQAGLAPSDKHVGLKDAVQHQLVTMQLEGDGATTASVTLHLKNRVSQPLEVALQKGDVLVPGKPGFR